jgi:hypothetical protein
MFDFPTVEFLNAVQVVSCSSGPGPATAEMGRGHASRQQVAAAKDPGPWALEMKRAVISWRFFFRLEFRKDI